MPKLSKRILSAVLAVMLLWAVVPVSAKAAEIEYLSYEEALPYFNFDTAVSNWCTNFGLDYETEYEVAKNAILAGTDRDFVIRLATYARDTGHGAGSLVVSNGFRPASYQEIIGLHDSNYYTGPFRNALTWNGRSLTQFWWSAEQAPGWPDAYTIDLSAYDIATLDLRYYYRAALRLWDNGWVGNYFAKPGCSAHNSGRAMDILSDWLGIDFKTEHTYNGVTYRMEDYGLYKPLQPSDWSAGETWHITYNPAVYAMGNYDIALDAGFEVAYGLYYNPASRGWHMADGRGLYIGAGVTVIQLRLVQLGLLEERYVTGYLCSVTENAIKTFQTQNGLVADGIVGSGTLSVLFPAAGISLEDVTAPTITAAQLLNVDDKGFDVQIFAQDDDRVSLLRVDTRATDSSVWVPRYYNAERTGGGVVDVDIWQEGMYAVRAAVIDAAGNMSPWTELPNIYVDMTAPRFKKAAVSNITDTGFTLSCHGEDNGLIADFTLTLADADGTVQTFTQTPDEFDKTVFSVTAQPGTEITVSLRDYSKNEHSYTVSWRYTGAEPGIGYSYHSPVS